VNLVFGKFGTVYPYRKENAAYRGEVERQCARGEVIQRGDRTAGRSRYKYRGQYYSDAPKRDLIGDAKGFHFLLPNVKDETRR